MPTSRTGLGQRVVLRWQASVLANASTESVKPRFFVEAYLAHLFAQQAEQPTEEAEQELTHEEPPIGQVALQEETAAPSPLPISLSQEVYEELTQQNSQRHEWIEQVGAQ